MLHHGNKKLIENANKLVICSKSKSNTWIGYTGLTRFWWYGVCQTVWYHDHKLAGNRAWGKRGEGKGPPRVRQWKFKKSQCLQTHELLLPTQILSVFHHCPLAHTSTEGGWITSWCHFLHFHLQSQWGTARIQTLRRFDAYRLNRGVWDTCL